MAKRRVRRPTEDAALARVMRDQKKEEIANLGKPMTHKERQELRFQRAKQAFEDKK